MLHENPDRSSQYKDATPAKLLDQLNENWKQLRIFAAAIGDRDRTIDQLYGSLAQRDKAIDALNGRLRYAKVRLVLLYSLIGGVAAEGAKVLFIALAKHVLGMRP